MRANGHRLRSGIHVRYQLAFELRDHIFQNKTAFFQSPNSKLIDKRIVRQAIAQIIYVAVTNAEFPEPRKLPERLSVYFVRH